MGTTGIQILKMVSKRAHGRIAKLSVSNVFHVPGLAADARRLGLKIDVIEVQSEDRFTHPKGSNYILVYAEVDCTWYKDIFRTTGASDVHFLHSFNLCGTRGFLYELSYY